MIQMSPGREAERSDGAADSSPAYRPGVLRAARELQTSMFCVGIRAETTRASHLGASAQMR
jgi:hypothetical protein